jgi:hypothetical protein
MQQSQFFVFCGKGYSQPTNRKINIDAVLVCIGATMASLIGRLK